MWAVWLFGILGVLFAGGLLTSYAEYRFDYNLYELLREKLTGKKD